MLKIVLIGLWWNINAISDRKPLVDIFIFHGTMLDIFLSLSGRYDYAHDTWTMMSKSQEFAFPVSSTDDKHKPLTSTFYGVSLSTYVFTQISFFFTDHCATSWYFSPMHPTLTQMQTHVHIKMWLVNLMHMNNHISIPKNNRHVKIWD